MQPIRNKPYAAAVAVPGVLLLWWAVSLWWNENGVMALIVGAAAAALLVGAYRISQADSFAPSKKSSWSSARSEGVTNWLDAQAAKDEQDSAKR